MNKVLWWIGAVIVLGVIVFFAFFRPQTSGGESIKIGAALGLTGYAAAWGEGELKAIQLAIEEFNKKKGLQVELIMENTKSTGEGTVNAVNKLVSADNVQAILGPTWGDSFQGAFPLLEKKRIPAVTPSGALEAVANKNDFNFLFSTWWPQKPEMETLVNYLSKKNLSRIALINDIDAFNQKAVELFSAEVKNKNLQIISHEEVPVGTTDFRTVITKIKNNTRESVYRYRVVLCLCLQPKI